MIKQILLEKNHLLIFTALTVSILLTFSSLSNTQIIIPNAHAEALMCESNIPKTITGTATRTSIRSDLAEYAAKNAAELDALKKDLDVTCMADCKKVAFPENPDTTLSSRTVCDWKITYGKTLGLAHPVYQCVANAESKITDYCWKPNNVDTKLFILKHPALMQHFKSQSQSDMLKSLTQLKQPLRSE